MISWLNKLKTILYLIILISFGATTSFLYQKNQRLKIENQQLSEKNKQQMNQLEQIISLRKKNEALIASYIKEMEQLNKRHATTITQLYKQINANENTQNWSNMPIPDDIARVLNNDRQSDQPLS